MYAITHAKFLLIFASVEPMLNLKFKARVDGIKNEQDRDRLVGFTADRLTRRRSFACLEVRESSIIVAGGENYSL